MKQTKNVYNNLPIDWSTAEALALDSFRRRFFCEISQVKILEEELLVRDILFLRNQDSHERYVPLNNISENQKKFEVIDTLLSELAV